MTNSLRMDQKICSLGKQLSSSLRERLKRCGRYHASPKSTSSSPGMTSTPSKDCIKENFISPLSRKRYSTTPLKIENPKRVQCDGSLSEQEGYDGIQTKLGTETSVKNEFKTEATSLSHQMGGDRQKTPLTSKSRFKHAKMRSSRLDFQNKHDSANSQSSNSSSVESHGQQGQDMLVLGSCDAGENKTTELLKVKDNQNLAGKCDLTIKDSDQTVETKTKHDLLKEVAIKEETLRKLRMVKTYRTKNNLSELQLLIDKWRTVSQQALQDLHTEMPEPKPSLTQLINHLGIEHDLIDFDSEEEAFNS